MSDVHRKDMQELPDNNLWLVMPAMGMVQFISSLDNTVRTIVMTVFGRADPVQILATALPTIAGEFKASASDYSWVGTVCLFRFPS